MTEEALERCEMLRSCGCYQMSRPELFASLCMRFYATIPEALSFFYFRLWNNYATFRFSENFLQFNISSWKALAR